MSEKETIGTESAAAPVEATPNTSTDAHYVSEEPTGDIALPAGWKYRGRRIAGINIPWYASPRIQLGMVAFVCFLCPGMFNALGGMGGGGKTDATLADNMVSFTPTSHLSFPKPQNSNPDLLFFATEHRSLLYLRRLRFLRWNFRQQTRC